MALVGVACGDHAPPTTLNHNGHTRMRRADTLRVGCPPAGPDAVSRSYRYLGQSSAAGASRSEETELPRPRALRRFDKECDR